MDDQVIRFVLSVILDEVKEEIMENIHEYLKMVGEKSDKQKRSI